MRQENFVFVFRFSLSDEGELPIFRKRNSRGVPIANRGKLRLEPRYPSKKDDLFGRTNFCFVVFLTNRCTLTRLQSKYSRKKDERQRGTFLGKYTDNEARSPTIFSGTAGDILSFFSLSSYFRERRTLFFFVARAKITRASI